MGREKCNRNKIYLVSTGLVVYRSIRSFRSGRDSGLSRHAACLAQGNFCANFMPNFMRCLHELHELRESSDQTSSAITPYIAEGFNLDSVSSQPFLPTPH